MQTSCMRPGCALALSWRAPAGLCEERGGRPCEMIDTGDPDGLLFSSASANDQRRRAVFFLHITNTGCHARILVNSNPRRSPARYNICTMTIELTCRSGANPSLTPWHACDLWATLMYRECGAHDMTHPHPARTTDAGGQTADGRGTWAGGAGRGVVAGDHPRTQRPKPAAETETAADLVIW